MAEDWAVVRHKAFTPENAYDIVAKIENCISNASGSGGYWEKDTSISQASGELLLKPLFQTFSPSPSLGNPNNQRIAFQAAVSGSLKIGYLPDGWDATATAFNDVINTSTKSWTGMRSITSSTAGIGALPARVWVAQMRDELTAASPYPGSSLTILLTAGSAPEIEYAAQVGRLIACTDNYDFGAGLFGDALLVGQVLDHVTNNSWLRGSQTVDATNNSVVRGGSTYWHYARVVYDPSATATNVVNGIARFVPYTIHGFGRARGGTVDNGTHCGVIGQLKYIREMDTAFDYEARLRSTTVGSNQRWRPAVYDATAKPQVFLWGPEVEVP